MTKKEPAETTNIYQKLHAVQVGFNKGIKKEKENLFQKYKYFDENNILEILKPLLETNKLVLLFSDVITPETPFIKEKLEKEWIVTYLKQLEIINADNTEEKLTFQFWAGGQNTDLAKAKGSAETYAVKYFLQKFFLIPAVEENLDPDKDNQETESKIIPPKHTKKTVTPQQVQEIYELLVKKRGSDLNVQTNFLGEIDKLMGNYGITGATNTSNFRGRLTSLTKEDYQSLWDYLIKLSNKE